MDLFYPVGIALGHVANRPRFGLAARPDLLNSGDWAVQVAAQRLIGPAHSPAGWTQNKGMPVPVFNVWIGITACATGVRVPNC